MKITSDRPPLRVYTAKGVSAAKPRTGAPGVPPAPGLDDATSILGIPEPEFTPRVRSAIMTLMAEVDRLRSELDQTRARVDALQMQADQDALLPVLNRRAFVREMSRMIAFAERYSVPVSLIYLDLNGFKAVNDMFGHSAGDAALSHICSLLLKHVRESDVVGRLGGDEFGVILAKADEATARRKAETLDENLRQDPALWQGAALALSFAYGVHPLRPGETATDAISAADQAMYAAKRAQRPSKD